MSANTPTVAPDGVSLAQSGKGTTLGIQSSTSGAITYAKVAELKTLDFSGAKNDTEDVTNFDSAGRAKEFIVTLVDYGEIKISGNYITTDTGQTLFRTNFASGNKVSFEITLPVNLAAGQATAGDTWVFLGAVTELDNTFSFDKAQQFSATVKVSGLIVVTPGT